MRPCCAIVRGKIAFHKPTERAALAIAGTPCQCEKLYPNVLQLWRQARRNDDERFWRQHHALRHEDIIAARGPGSTLKTLIQKYHHAMRATTLACGALLVDEVGWWASPGRLSAGIDAVAKHALATASSTQDWVAVARHLRVGPSRKWTDAGITLTIASPDGKCWVFAAHFAAHSLVTERSIAMRLLPVAADLFDRRVASTRKNEAWERVRRACRRIDSRQHEVRSEGFDLEKLRRQWLAIRRQG